VIGDRQMADDARGTADGAVRSDTRAACNGCAAGHRSVRADAYVMADLIWLSSLTPFSITVSSSAPRRSWCWRPISTSSL